MRIINVKTDLLKEYENNPRKNEKAVEMVKKSIRDYGFRNPILIDENNVIVAGHTRLKAAKELGYEELPCILVEDLTEEQIKAYRIIDNKTNEFADWDYEKLEMELASMEIDLSDFEIDLSEFEEIEIYDKEKSGKLADRFIVPPFSIINTVKGEWQERKNLWKKIIKSEIGRDENLIGEGWQTLAKKTGGTYSNGTSLFDPVLCEILINWFSPKNSNILDVFAGGSVRGLVSSYLGRKYTGIDLSNEQIKANYSNYQELKNTLDFNGGKLYKPNWINDDSLNVDKLVSDNTYDYLYTCPPYVDLEVYSDDKRDISNMSYDNFINTYSNIFNKTYPKLKDNAFATIVVGEVRNKQGNYYNFVGDTITTMKKAGYEYYNECILKNAVGTGAMRVNGQFSKSRKIVKIHQNVLTFVKGDPHKINLENVDYNIEEYLE